MPSKKQRKQDKFWSDLYRSESTGVEPLSDFKKRFKKLRKQGF